MPRTVADVDAEIEAKKAAGVHQASREMKALRAERAALEDGQPGPCPGEDARDDLDARRRAIATTLALPIPSAALPASDDVAFVNEALAQLLLKGKGAGKIEQCYSDIRALLGVKHIIEDAAGLKPSGRIDLPHWNTLGRERDTGVPFKPGENQAIVDGLEQRAVPPPKSAAAAASRPSITNPDGTPLRLPRTRIDEPEGNAEFVTAGESAE